MSERNLPPQFEEDITRSFGVPAIRAEFVEQVYADLLQRAAENPRRSPWFLGLRPAWTAALIVLTFMLIGTLVIGPQRVYAEVARLFGYIPEVGIVDQSAPISRSGGTGNGYPRGRLYYGYCRNSDRR